VNCRYYLACGGDSCAKCPVAVEEMKKLGESLMRQAENLRRHLVKIGKLKEEKSE